MKSYHNDVAHSLVPEYFLKAFKMSVSVVHDQLHDALYTEYQTAYSFIKLPFDHALHSEIKSLIDAKKRLNAALLIVIGIGGSNLGTKAVHEFLNGIYSNDSNHAIPCYFLDTLDPDLLEVILSRIAHYLIQGRDILVNIVSKSGITLETIGNFSVVLDLLKKHRPENYQATCVITTDRDSALWNYAHQEGYDCLAVPQSVGGRYSVFSAVGLFPLGMLGVDIDALQAGARDVITDLLEHHDDQIIYAAARNLYHLEQGRSIQDMFLFGTELESIGKWYRQLFAETLGKQKERGITPTVSIGSTDLHSMGQLYCGGPDDKYYTLVSVAQGIHDYTVSIPLLPPQAHDKSMNVLMSAIKQGLQQVFEQDHRPFESWSLAKKDAYSIAQFLQFYMLRVVYLAAALGVNPFDQPEVERYKRKMQEILDDE
jgi:glucose-6-phosphate isomerase